MTPAPLFLNRDASFDWLIALPFGVACDGHPPERFRAVGRSAAWFLAAPGGEVAGFVIHRLRDQGKTLLLVEQNVEWALRLADRAVIIDQGEVVHESSAAALLADKDIQDRYCAV